jgi:hypothetical protein
MVMSSLGFKSAVVLVSTLAISIYLPASAQTVPTIDTEDATLGLASVSSGGHVHLSVAFDARNGDFARGNYDDDRADRDRLPVHAQIGLAVELSHDADGAATGWLVLRSSNGFHAPKASEQAAPRSWYESNNLAAIVLSPAEGLRAAAVYTMKTSPNGVSGTTHEASLALTYAGDNAVGAISPQLAVTVRPKGDDGVFTIMGIEPSQELAGHDGPTLSLPLAVGIGWHGFYGAHTADRAYVSAGVAIEQPFALGDTKWSARVEAAALIRDARLAALSGPDGETGRVAPLISASVAMAY